jgi:hypothetical protein
MFINWRVLFITFVLGRGIYLHFLLRCFCIVSLEEAAAAGGVLQVLCYFPYLTGLGILSFEDVATL